MIRTLLFLFFLFNCLALYAVEGLTVNLINPTYCQDTLFTKEGGIVEAPGLWVQATEIAHHEDEQEHYLIASGDLLIDYCGQFLRAESLYYDLKRHTGRLIGARFIAFPWVIGGAEVVIEQRKIRVLNGYVTPNTSVKKDIIVTADEVQLDADETIAIENATFRLGKLLLLQLPRLSFSLHQSEDLPVTFLFGWHGFKGTFLGIRRHWLQIGELKTYLRLDAYLGHGPGAGFETIYHPENCCARSLTRSYYAHDISIADPHERSRYRFQGYYRDCFWDNTTSIDLKYDKVSDAQMASDYLNDDFELETAHKSELLVNKSHRFWTLNLIARAKLNDFQSVNQALPTLEWTLLPFEIGSTGVVFENFAYASYLNYAFSNNIPQKENFHSGRFEMRPALWRHFDMGELHLLPQLKAVGIYYTNSPLKQAPQPKRHHGSAVMQAVVDMSLDITTALYSQWGCCRHIIEPYSCFHFLTTPTVPLDEHYIFTLEDSYARLLMNRIGMRHLIAGECEIPLRLDIWANVFFQKNAFSLAIPKGYLEGLWDVNSYLQLIVNGAWNFDESQVDFFDFRTRWTLSEDAALDLTYRHRSRFDFRKADYTNYLLEIVRSKEQLVHSQLSDPRDLVLVHLFYRPHPNVALDFELRGGWHRPHESAFLEYQVGLETPIFENFRLGFTYEKKHTDNRFSFSFNYAPRPPS